MTITERFLMMNIQIGTAKTTTAQITSAMAALRKHFYTATLPWKDNGDRLLPSALYFSFMVTHTQLVDNFEKAVCQCLDEIEFRHLLLTPLPNIRDKFYVNLDVDLVPEVVAVGDVQQYNLMRTAHIQRIDRAMREVWQRLGNMLGHSTAKMSDGGIYRDSTVEKLVRIR